MLTQANLGDLVSHNGIPMRVIRIIPESTSLFEDETGKQTIVKEGYIELKSASGMIEFYQIFREETEYTGGPSAIKGMQPIPWKEKA